MKPMKLTTSAVVLFICITLLVFTFSAQAQDRGSVWVHGLNSRGSDWSNWENLFRYERQLYLANPNYRYDPQDYNTTGGVASAAGQVNNSFPITPDNRTIYFGHSMGGVVGRHMDVNYSSRFGGIVTFGSPLDGANIANSVANGQADSFIANGVNKVAQGPVRELGIVTYIIWGLVADEVVSGIRNKVIKINPTTDQGARDLQESSSYMNSGVRNATTSTPKIHVYGNEQSPVLWRMASSTQSFSNGGYAYNDTYYVDFANTAGDIYETAMWVNYGIAAATAWWTFGVGGIYFSWVADGWMEGKNWWRYDAEGGWNSLIGSNTFVYRSVTYSTFDYNQFYQCMFSGGSYYSPSYLYDDCQRQATSTVTYYYYSPVNGQSDGFIKAPSQTGYNSDWSNNATKIEALGVNHIEMLDNDKVRIIMDGIFNGVGVDQFFRTPPR